MSTPSGTSLKRRLDEIDGELGWIKKEDHRLSERLRKLDAKEKQTPRSLSKALSIMVLFLFHVCSCTAEVPILFLEGAGRLPKFKRQQRYPGEFKELVETLYIRADPDFIAELTMCPYDFLTARQVRGMCVYMLECNIFEFSLSANHDKGVAPSSSLLGSRWKTLIPTSIPAHEQNALKYLLIQNTHGRSPWLSRLPSA